ncbi:hypothetical protein [Streptomyces katrae]|uniref:hypothetical protein n=1 Tax=Streptomyces katrae TaxID=68223 RepID=UPI00131BA4A6|nr:hypothetical protein [Streptomyces katrae]
MSGPKQQNDGMVAIIKCRDYELDDLRWLEELHQARRLEWEWTVTRPLEFWPKGRHLLLIASADRYGQFCITHVGKSRRGKRAADKEQQLRITQVRPLRRPLALTELLDAVPGNLQRHLVEEGQQTKGTGEALRAMLLRLRPELREVVDLIEGSTEPWNFGSSAAGQAISLQRDATIGATRMAGFKAQTLAEWDPPAEELYDDSVPLQFLDLVPAVRGSGRPLDAPDESASLAFEEEPLHTHPALEDHLVAHDAEGMLGWLTERTSHVAWRKFHEHGRTLLVANANRTPVESLLGCDIIFYNVARQSMVLIQYKKLDAERGGFYYPNSDRNLQKELNRMASLDRYAELNRGVGNEQRLDPSPSWIKLCHPRSLLPHTSEMIHGMYFSRRQFESLRRDARLKDGRGGAVRFGYKNVPGYLDNTLFTRLVETGQIGTTGTSTDLVRQQVIRSFRGERSHVLAALHGDEPPQAQRNAQRREER